MGSLDAAQFAQVAAQFKATGDEARSLLFADNVELNGKQTSLIAADMTRCYDIAAFLTSVAAGLSFADTETADAVKTIVSAVAAANAKIVELKPRENQIRTIIGVLAEVAALGVSLGGGSTVGVITAATTLTNTVKIV